MNVNGITVRYERLRVPADYEKATPMVELHASLSDDDNEQECLDALMRMAIKPVWAAIGEKVPAKVAEQFGIGDKPLTKEDEARLDEIPADIHAPPHHDEAAKQRAKDEAFQKTMNAAAEADREAEALKALADAQKPQKPQGASEGTEKEPDGEGPTKAPDDEPKGDGKTMDWPLRGSMTPEQKAAAGLVPDEPTTRPQSITSARLVAGKDLQNLGVMSDDDFFRAAKASFRMHNKANEQQVHPKWRGNRDQISVEGWHAILDWVDAVRAIKGLSWTVAVEAIMNDRPLPKAESLQLQSE